MTSHAAFARQQTGDTDQRGSVEQELSKLVPVSPNRVESVAVGADDVALSVLGAAGERVEMTFFAASQIGSEYNGWDVVICTVGASGKVTMHYPSKQCT